MAWKSVCLAFGSTSPCNARFPHGPSAHAFTLNLCGSILNTTGPALRDLAVGWLVGLPQAHGYGREPNGSLPEKPVDRIFEKLQNTDVPLE